MNIENTMKNLKNNGMKPYFVEKKEDVIPLIETLVSNGESVSHGGSETLKQCKIVDFIKENEFDYIDRFGLEGEELRQAYIKAFGCDTYFTSSNAVTENGELYNVDGNSNRVACIVYGPKQVIVIVGINKIVKNINEAVERVKTVAAPPNTKRLGLSTPCSKTGKCISLSDENAFICHGCKTDDRICCNYVISAKQRHKDRIKVIIVNEELGY